MSLDMPLRTQRLTLRDFAYEDWQAVHRYAVDPEVVRYMVWGPNTEAETQQFVRRTLEQQSAEPRRHFGLAVTLNADARLIGACNITAAGTDDRGGCIGYVLHRDHWRQGYAAEAARALLAFGFGPLGLHRIIATCDTENGASARVMEKAGMRREGRLLEHKWIKGRWRDSFLYAILDREWDRLQTARLPCPGQAPDRRA
jgi:ribosomal-protein-alanine N-acetyltransferase